MAKRFFIKPFMKWYRQLLRNSKYRWIVLLGTLFYLVSPIDIVPDAIPVLGWIDDGLIATIAITEISQILLNRKRNLRQAVGNATTTAVVEPNDSVIDVDSIAVV